MGRKAVTLGVSQKLGTGYSWLLEERNRGTGQELHAAVAVL